MVDYLVYSWDDEMVESMVEGTVAAMDKWLGVNVGC